MGKLNVKGGTPFGSVNLCKSCTWVQYTVGYKETDVLVICQNANPNIQVPFPVHECSDYNDKRLPNWEQMEKLAITIEPTRTSKKTAGFKIAEILRPASSDFDESEDEDDFEDSEGEGSGDKRDFVDAVARSR